MELRPYLSENRVLDLQCHDKEEVLRLLCEAVAPHVTPPVDAEEILIQVLLRERAASTGVGHGVGLPHARINMDQECLIAIGLHREGLDYHSADKEPVQLIALVVVAEAKPNLHLQILSQLAATFCQARLRTAILAADSPRELIDLLSPAGFDPTTTTGEITPRWRVNTELVAHAEGLAASLMIDTILVHIDPLDDLSALNLFSADRRLILMSSAECEAPALVPQVVGVIQMPWSRLSMDAQVSLALMLASARNLIRATEPVLCLTADPRHDALTGIMIQRFQDSPTAGLPISTVSAMSSIHHDVLERVVSLAVKLADEGREGKPVGTIFVVGDPAQLRQYCSQLVINPFKGYEEAERNVLDPRLEETMKEFSAIDGAFIIRGDGVVESAGTYLTPKGGAEELLSGLGARHRAAAAITRHTNALAVVVSQSTRTVSVFHAGSLVLSVERVTHVPSGSAPATPVTGLPPGAVEEVLPGA